MPHTPWVGDTCSKNFLGRVIGCSGGEQFDIDVIIAGFISTVCFFEITEIWEFMTCRTVVKFVGKRKPYTIHVGELNI